MKSEETARRRGQKLLNRIKLFNKSDMNLVVWESFGRWHYAVYIGALCIFPTELDEKHETFAVTLGKDTKINQNEETFQEWIVPEHFKDPNKAIVAQLKHAQHYINKLQLVVDYMNNKMKGKRKK